MKKITSKQEKLQTKVNDFIENLKKSHRYLRVERTSSGYIVYFTYYGKISSKLFKSK